MKGIYAQQRLYSIRTFFAMVCHSFFCQKKKRKIAAYFLKWQHIFQNAPILTEKSAKYLVLQLTKINMAT